MNIKTEFPDLRKAYFASDFSPFYLSLIEANRNSCKKEYEKHLVVTKDKIAYISELIEGIFEFEKSAIQFYKDNYSHPRELNIYKSSTTENTLYKFEYLRLTKGYYLLTNEELPSYVIHVFVRYIEYKEFLQHELALHQPSKPKKIINGFDWIGSEKQLLKLHTELIANKVIADIPYNDFSDIFRSIDTTVSITWRKPKRLLAYFLEGLIHKANCLREGTAYNSIVTKTANFITLPTEKNKKGLINATDLTTAKGQSKNTKLRDSEIIDTVLNAVQNT